VLPWLRCRPAAPALSQLLAQELPFSAGVALKKKKKKKSATGFRKWKSHMTSTDIIEKLATS